MNLNAITDIWAWWSGHILELVPAVDPRTLANRLTKTEIQLNRGGARLLRNQRLKSRTAAKTQEAEFQDIENTARQLRPREKVILSIDDSLCFARETMIPAAASNRAGEILNLEFTRVSPLRRQDILGVWFPNGQVESGKLGMTHVVVRRDTVKTAVDVLAQRKILVAAVAFRNQDQAAAPAVLDENGLQYGLRRELFWKRSAAAFGTLFATAALALSWHWMSKLEGDLKLAREGLPSVQVLAAANRKAIDEKQSLTHRLTELQKFKQQRRSTLEIWSELTKIIPDAAWLQSLSQKEDTVLLDGTAADAESLIQYLEASKLFRNVRFVSPVIKNPGEEKVRFSISMELERAKG
jgi:general secretion pathway protein L